MALMAQNPQTGQWVPWDPNDPNFHGNVNYNGTIMSDALAREQWQRDQAAANQPPDNTQIDNPGFPGGGVQEQGPDAYHQWNGGSPPSAPLQPGHGWTWDGQQWTQTAGSGMGYTAPSGPSGGGNLDQGSNTPYQPSDPGGGGGGGGGGSSSGSQGQGKIDYEEPGDIPVFDAPEWQAPPEFKYDKQFGAPDEAALKADPSFQFRLDQGRKALEQSAAGRGLLRSGGTLKDLVDYGQNFATQEYANVYNRKFNEYKFDYDKEADIYQTNYGLSKDKFDKQYKAAYDEYQPKLTGWQTRTTGKQRAQEAMFNRDWQTYIADRDRDLRLRQIEQGDWS